jgi:hypothetical protein
VEFIDDDSDFENYYPGPQRTAETSRHFETTTETRNPYVPKDDMEGCDEFERSTTDELFTQLVRLRNDVRPGTKNTDISLQTNITRGLSQQLLPMPL